MPDGGAAEGLARDTDLLGRRESACRRYLQKKIDAIVAGFQDQAPRSDSLDGWWNIYNCQLDDNQFYNGNAQIYVPIIHDAVNARATRFVNQLFPQSGRYVDVTATDGEIPYEIVALANHYIGQAKLKTAIVKPLLRNGDLEGQYNLYVDWSKVSRQVVSRETHRPTDPQTGLEAPGEEIVEIVEEEVEEGGPAFEVLHDSDVLVLPQTADTIEQAFAAGGSATIVRRWSREKYEAMIEDGELRPETRETAAVEVTSTLAGMGDLAKKLARDVGVRAKGPHIVMFETWVMIPLSARGSFGESGKRRLCRVWWTLDKEPRGAKRNPYWNDRCPLLSAPVEKIAGVFKGKSLVEPLAPLQYEANDAANERADADHYGAMPIIARKPGEGNAPLVLNLAAIWDVDPADIQFMAFPDLSQRANARIVAATTVIFQSLGVNPAMLPQQSGRPGAKRNQAEVAMEQAVDLLTTAEAVSVVDESILSPLVAQVVDLDYQFRDNDLTVRAFGQLGVRAEMISVPPLQNRTHYHFSWAGSEQARLNVAMQQQGTAFLNVLRGLRQELQAEGFHLRLGPLLERAAINIFGPVTGSLMLEDSRRQLSMDPQAENDLMADGFTVSVHPLDDDQQHIMAHSKALRGAGDPHGTVRVHLQAHLQQAHQKAQAAMAMAMMQQMQGGQGGPPGGGAGATPPGAVPAGPRQSKGPPGMIAPDRMPRAGAIEMPRKM